MIYQRIRAYNVEFYLKRNREQYKKDLAHLIKETQKGCMYGEWNDYGRLLERSKKSNALLPRRCIIWPHLPINRYNLVVLFLYFAFFGAVFSELILKSL